MEGSRLGWEKTDSYTPRSEHGAHYHKTYDNPECGVLEPWTGQTYISNPQVTMVVFPSSPIELIVFSNLRQFAFLKMYL